MIVWVVCLPLVHIYPEADHAHGMSGHVHGGTFHTDVSSTPVCAYENHRHHLDSFSPGEPFGVPDSSAPPPHGFEHSTYGFFVLISSIDPPLLKEMSCIAPAMIWCPLETLSLSCVSSITLFSLSETPASILLKTLLPRAPPIFSV